MDQTVHVTEQKSASLYKNCFSLYCQKRKQKKETGVSQLQLDNEDTALI